MLQVVDDGDERRRGGGERGRAKWAEDQAGIGDQGLVGELPRRSRPVAAPQRDRRAGRQQAADATTQRAASALAEARAVVGRPGGVARQIRSLAKGGRRRGGRQQHEVGFWCEIGHGFQQAERDDPPAAGGFEMAKIDDDASE